MLKTVVLFVFFIPLLKAMPLKVEAPKNLNALGFSQNQVKRIPDCESGYSDDAECEGWKNDGYCEEISIYHQWMLDNCKVACGECRELPTPSPTPTPDCESGYIDYTECEEWKNDGYCEENNDYHQWMLDNCKVACGECRELTTQPPTTPCTQSPSTQWTQPPSTQWTQPPTTQWTQPSSTQWTQSPSTQWTQPPYTQWTQPPSTQWTQPPSTQWTQPPSTQWTQPPTTQWTQSPSTQWTQPPSTQWTQPPSTQWTQPPTTQWTRPPSTQWTQPPSTQWTLPPTTQWTQSPSTQWTQSPTTQWTQTPTTQWTQLPSTQWTQPPTTQPYSTPEKITFNIDDCLAASNLNRTTRHGVPSLQWDATLASESADWAIYLANKATVSLEHSSGNYGENLFYKGSYPPGSLASCKDAVMAWYSEIDDYDFNNPGTSTNGKVIGHFTQVVWKSTTKVGVGIAAVTRPYNGNSFTYTFVVARYTPPGNYEGQYAENVPNLISK